MVLDIRTGRPISEPVAAGDCVILTAHPFDGEEVITDENMLPVLFRVYEGHYKNTVKKGIFISDTFVALDSLGDITYQVIKDYKAHRKDFSPEIAGKTAAKSF